jgi:hypothetical protein
MTAVEPESVVRERHANDIRGAILADQLDAMAGQGGRGRQGSSVNYNTNSARRAANQGDRRRLSQLPDLLESVRLEPRGAKPM